MFSTGFARDLAERVIATFAQALVAVLIAANTGLLDTDWVAVLSVAGMTALISLLKGLGAYGMDNETGASLLTSPPPRVENGDHGHTSALYLLVVILVVVLILAVFGVL